MQNKRIPVAHLLLIGFWPSFLKKLIYLLLGYKIGKKVRIGFGSVLIGKNVTIGANSRIGFLTFIICKEIRIHNFVRIGSLNYINTRSFEIGEDSITSELVTVGGLKNSDSLLKVGERCHIMQNTFLNPTKQIIIGDNVGIGGNCQLFTHSSRLSIFDGFPVTFAPVNIKNNVWIAWNVFIFPGVTVESNSIISAGSIVSGNIPKNCIASGNPAKIKLKNIFQPVDEGRRRFIMEDIFNSFKEYLESLGFDVNLESNEPDIVLYENRRNSMIHYYKSGLDKFSLGKNSLLVMDIDCDIKSMYHKKRGGQILSLIGFERIGSSKIGEEFTRFLSRYGIRFKRLD